MTTRPAFPASPTLVTSHLGYAVSCPTSLGEILEAVARLHALNTLLNEVAAELAALRASEWTAPSFEVVTAPSISRSLGRWAHNGELSHGKGTIHPEFIANERHFGLKLRVVETLETPDKCKHGLKSDWCGPCIRLTQSGKSKQRVKTRRVNYVPNAILVTGVSNSGSHEVTWSIPRYFVKFFVEGNLYPGQRYEPACLRRVEPHHHQVTPEDVASGQWKHVVGICTSENAIIREFAEPLTDWCPICKEYVDGNHDAKGIACKKWREKLDAKAVRVAKTLEDFCAKWEVKRQQQRLAKLREAQSYVYSPEDFDRDILELRGSVTAEAVRKFDKDFSRKGNKYRIR